MTDIDQDKAVEWLRTMLATVRDYDKEFVRLIMDFYTGKKITVEHISNLYGYAECIASEQRQCEREFNKQVGLVPKVGQKPSGGKSL